MAKKIKVDVEVNDQEIDQTNEKFVKLQTRIRETKIALQKAVESGDTKSIKKLREDLDELQDTFEKSQIQSKKFGDSLASVPGPAGMAGKAMKGLDDAFKFLLANPIVAIIAGIAAALMGMYKALTQTKEGQQVLNKITDAFGAVLEVVTNIVSTVAIPVFEFFGKVINTLASAFAYVTGKTEEYNKALADKEAARQFEANAQRIKTLLDEEGFKYDEFTRRKIEADQKYNERLAAINKSKDSDEEKRRRTQNAVEEKNKAIAQADIDRAKKVADAQKDAADKAKAAADKAFSDKLARMQSEDKLDEAKLEKLKQEALQVAKTEREKFEVESRFSAQKYQLQKTNLEQLQSQYKKDSKEYRDYQTQLINLDAQRVAEITQQKDRIKKLNEQEVKDKKEAVKLLEDTAIAAIQDEDQRALTEYNKRRQREKDELIASKAFLENSEAERKRILSDFDQATDIANEERQRKIKEKALQDDTDLLNIRKDTVVEGTNEYFNILRQIEDNAYQQNILAAKGNAQKIEAIEKQHKANLKNIAMQEKIAQFQIAKERLDGIAAFGQQLGKLAGKNKAVAKAALLIEKAAAIGQIVANTGIANAKAVAASPLTAGLPWTAINTATAVLAIANTVREAVKGIQEIDKVQVPDGGASSGVGAGAAGATPAFGGTVQAAAPQIGATAVGAQGQLGNIIGQAVNRDRNTPIQTYVIGSQVSSQQELDRRITLTARLGG